MNIMIVSVTERTREIGVRKSLGAKKSTIAWQFFVETLIIGQFGGFVGIILGTLIGYGFICIAMDFEFVIPWAQYGSGYYNVYCSSCFWFLSSIESF